MSVQTQNMMFVVTDHAHAKSYIHMVCECNEDVALCGKDLTGRPFADGSVECVVCADLDRQPCPLCGAWRAA